MFEGNSQPSFYCCCLFARVIELEGYDGRNLSGDSINEHMTTVILNAAKPISGRNEHVKRICDHGITNIKLIKGVEF